MRIQGSDAGPVAASTNLLTEQKDMSDAVAPVIFPTSITSRSSTTNWATEQEMKSSGQSHAD
ncbi:hypothetical protein WI92_26945 [Burkholderia vietnamiensis]|nr:hypothetical protein WI92_26945 [Burkholderia vietnamiensis]